MHVVATAGHVDHGKSTLVAALTGIDPDRLAEEKRRGLTIDLGFAATVLPSGREISFVDVPGHANFIENMLAGVGVLRQCLFVVSANEGWKPQSEEHLRILELFGFSRGVIAITKVDLVDEENRGLVRREVAEAVSGTFLEGAAMIDTDARHQGGLELLTRALDEVVTTEPVEYERERPRLWIDRSFSVRGAGNVITGTLTGGSLAENDLMDLIPTGSGHAEQVRVRSLQVHNKSLQRAAPGHRVAVNITGLEQKSIGRGQAIVRRGQWAPTRTVDASLRVLSSLDHEVTRRGAYQAYVGSAHHPVKLRILGDAAILPGGSGLVRLHFPVALPLVRGDRYVLRESGRSETVGGGEIFDVEPILPASSRPNSSIDRLVAERGWVLVEHLEKLSGERLPANVGDQWRVHPSTLEQSKERLRTMVADAGPLGLDIGKLDARDRALVGEMSELVVEGIRVRSAAELNHDPLANHPYIVILKSAPFSPASPQESQVEKDVLDELVRRGLILKWEDFYFPRDVMSGAGEVVAQLLVEHPGGVSVAQVKETMGTTRRFALPLLRLLDANGVTRRRGDLRIAGPRLPVIDPQSRDERP